MRRFKKTKKINAYYGKGISYIKPINRTPPKPRSPGQLTTQEKMKFLNKFLVPFHPYITVGMKNEAEKQTEINAAFKANYHETIIRSYPHLSVDYPKFIFSKGNLTMVSERSLELIAPNASQFSWGNLDAGKGSFNDQTILVVYCHEL
jgi:hypothetical protein